MSSLELLDQCFYGDDEEVIVQQSFEHYNLIRIQ